MRTTSAAYKTAIDAATRHILFKVEIYFDGDAASPTTFTAADIIDSQVVYEANAGAEQNYLIGSQDLSISFKNEDGRFTKDNTLSPFYGKMERGKRVIAYFEVLLGDGSYESVKVGTFFIDAWNRASDMPVVTLTCYSRLKDILEKELPLLPSYPLSTFQEMFTRLFMAAGLTVDEIVFKGDLTGSCEYGWFPGDIFDDALVDLAMASSACVTEDADGRIVVQPIIGAKTVTRSYTDDVQVFTSQYGEQNFREYQDAKVTYHVPSQKEPDIPEVTMEGLTIKAGEQNIKTIDICDTPIYELTSIVLISPDATMTMLGYTLGATKVALKIQSNVDTTATIKINGREIGISSLVYSTAAEGVVTKVLSVHSELVQSQMAAIALATKAIKICNTLAQRTKLPCRMDPSTELFDLVYAKHTQYNSIDANVLPVRIVLDWNGALSGEMEVVKYDTISV